MFTRGFLAMRAQLQLPWLVTVPCAVAAALAAGALAGDAAVAWPEPLRRRWLRHFLPCALLDRLAEALSPLPLGGHHAPTALSLTPTVLPSGVGRVALAWTAFAFLALLFAAAPALPLPPVATSVRRWWRCGVAAAVVVACVARLHPTPVLATNAAAVLLFGGAPAPRAATPASTGGRQGDRVAYAVWAGVAWLTTGGPFVLRNAVVSRTALPPPAADAAVVSLAATLAAFALLWLGNAGPPAAVALGRWRWGVATAGAVRGAQCVAVAAALPAVAASRFDRLHLWTAALPVAALLARVAVEPARPDADSPHP